jgi:hypothetical protein
MDSRLQPDSATADPAPTGTPDPPAGSRTADAVDRRGFVRAIAGDSITTAGMLAGLTGALTGSLMAAAKAGGAGLAALGAPASPDATTTVTRSPSIPAPAAPTPVPAGLLTLTDADRQVLESLTVGLLSTNQAGGPPAVGIVRFRWDGSAFRIPGRSATARTTNLQGHPYAALTLIDPTTGNALLAAGGTHIIYGAEGRDEAATVLTACEVPLPDDWDRADHRGEPVLIVLQPQRLFRRSPADERP